MVIVNHAKKMGKTKLKRTPAGDKFTDLVLEIFKLNGSLKTAGDQLSKDLGLTSARWKVLGALGQGPLTVSQIARKMGLTRQNVQQLVNNLAQKELVSLKENPDHQTAKLIQLNDSGRDVLGRISLKQIEWANRISSALETRELETALKTLILISKNLD